MKILHVVPYFSGAWAFGGIPRVVSGLARSLANEGHEVCVLTTGVEGSQPTRSWESVEDGVRIHMLPNLSRRLAERYQLFLPLGASRFLYNLPVAFELVHIHGCHHLLGVLAGRHFLKAGVPYVISPHGTAPRIEQRILAKYVFDQFFWNRVFYHADHYHAVSRYEENQLRDMGIPPGKITAIHPGFNADEFSGLPGRGAFRNRYRIPEGEKLILYLGRISPRKGIEHLVQAFSGMGRPDIRLVIAGNDSGHRSTITRLVRRLRISDRVLFPGLLEERERLEAYVDADIIAYPSTLEVFGLVPCEAVFCGTPVVITRESGCAEVLNGIRGVGKVSYGDVEGLKKALLEGLDYDNADGARAVLRDKLDWERSGKEIADLYGKVITKAGIEKKM